MEKFTHIMLNLHNNTKCYYECWKTAFNNSRTNQTWNSNNLLFQQPKHQSRTWSTFSTERNGSCFLIEVSESHPSSSRTKSLGQWTSWCDSIKFATAEKNWSVFMTVTTHQKIHLDFFDAVCRHQIPWPSGQGIVFSLSAAVVRLDVYFGWP